MKGNARLKDTIQLGISNYASLAILLKLKPFAPTASRILGVPQRQNALVAMLAKSYVKAVGANIGKITNVGNAM